jgi:hypothetical protein
MTRKLDYEDYLQLPDDGKRYEILDGELYVTGSRITSRSGGSERCSTLRSM